jgi:outer membrane protein TolC
VEQRKIQLKDAEKDFEVADGRYKFGVAKLSDVLQASVRLEQARFNLIQTEGNLKKGLSDLNSLIGRPLDTDDDLQSISDIEVTIPDIEKLSVIALDRPEIKQAEDSIQISDNSKSLIRSTFFPVFSADASYIKSEGDIIGSLFREEKTATLRATWNIFEFGKFYTYRSADFEKNVSVENLSDIKRKVMLDVRKTFEDFMTSWNKLKVAKTQLQQAEHNYSQAFGEYKVGKADILSLIQAESLLADSREQVVLSKLSLMLSKALLERVAGISKLESLNP